jgi:hypothetical protein
MVCMDRDTVASYLCGDLDPADADQWAAHLTECPVCRSLVGEISALLDTVRRDLQTLDEELPETPPPSVELVKRRVAKAHWLTRVPGSQLLGGRVLTTIRGRLAPFRPSSSGWTVVAPGDAALRRPEASRLGLPLWSRVVLAGLALTAIWWGARTFGTTPVSAAELLQASSQAEAARLPQPGFVAHRVYTIHRRYLPAALPVSTQRVELWIEPTTRVKARRVFDDRQRLLAGEWTAPDGSRIVYEQGKAPRHERAGEPKPLTADTIWRWDPSAADFSDLAGRAERIHARATDSGFQLAIGEASGPLAEAELSLDKNHVPLGQRIVLREGSRTIEFQTARGGADDLADARAVRAAFEPEAELLPAAPLPLGDVVPPAPRVAAAPAPAAAPPVLSAVALSGLELQALYRLSRLGPCLTAPGEIQRMPAGQLSVALEVATAACRAEAQRDLDSLAATPGVRVDITVAEASAAPPSTEPIPIDALPGAAGASGATGVLADDALARIPVYADLFEFYARHELRDRATGARDVDATVNPMVRRLVSWALARSAHARENTRAMRQLADRWSPETLQALGLDPTAMWRAMVRDHARVVAQDAEILLAQLQPVMRTGGRLPDEATAVPAIRTLADAHRAIADLSEAVTTVDAALQALLSPAPRAAASTPGAAPDTAAVARQLGRMGRLADRFAEPWALDQ